MSGVVIVNVMPSDRCGLSSVIRLPVGTQKKCSSLITVSAVFGCHGTEYDWLMSYAFDFSKKYWCKACLTVNFCFILFCFISGLGLICRCCSEKPYNDAMLQ